MRISPGVMAVAAIMVFLTGVGTPSPAVAQVTIEPGEDRYTVKIDGELFTQYIFKGYDKPILYPIIGPHGISMTRNWPMKEGVEGEAKDHPHHKALWFAHGDVNGVDFWAEKGKIVSPGAPILDADGDPLHIGGREFLRDPDGQHIAHQQTWLKFTAVGTARIIDVRVGLWGSDALTFGDTKEGTMAIRTRPELEINHGAKAVNSEGVTGKEIWGKRAKWVDYSGVVDGKTVGIAIFDHPSNPRHPTWWHAREYGLIAANPFGIHDFEKGQPKGAGNMTIPAGESVTFRYRFVFHEGDAQAAGIAKMYDEYAKKSGSTSNAQREKASPNLDVER